MKQLLSVVDFIHSKGYVIRNLHPKNILIDANDNLFLKDFQKTISISNLK